MATQAVKNMRWAGGPRPPLVYADSSILVTAGQTFVAGDLVTITRGTGTISEYAANGPNVAGFALSGATAALAANINVPIQAVDTNSIYIGNIYSGASATATAITQLGMICAVRTPSAGVWVVDIGTTTDTDSIVQIVGFVYGPDWDTNGSPYTKAMGDTGGEVYFRFVTATIDTADGSLGSILDFAV
jgi:hypothetical protein